MSDILIIELGSQHTHQIARAIAELGHEPVILPPHEAQGWLRKKDPRCVIGSGGFHSVYSRGAPRVPEEAFMRHDGSPRAYLGICYGMQDLSDRNGAVVRKGRPEYAKAIVDVGSSPLFAGLDPKQQVWMSHGDSVFLNGNTNLREIARSKDTGNVAAIEHTNGKHFGVQFHPEVSHTVHGAVVLRNFLEQIAGLATKSAKGPSLDSIRAKLLSDIGNARAIIGFSGGVDSTTLAKIASVLGDRLLAICIDGGHLRENELDEIKRHAQAAGVKLKIVNASEEMIAAVATTTDPEEKRARFREQYAAVFQREALGFGNGGGVFILQASLAPDMIESGKTGGAKIKTHHNVGLSFGDLPQLHPFERLYKDEVRKLARELDLPSSVFNRPPFPGPGNFLRVVNIPVTREALEVVRWAEARTREILAKSPTYRDVSQLVVAVSGRATGVKGDSPVYGYSIAVRAVRTKDFMTAEGVEFSPAMQRRIKTKLGEHPLVTQVGFFPTDKPPGTTEFE